MKDQYIKFPKGLSLYWVQRLFARATISSSHVKHPRSKKKKTKSKAGPLARSLAYRGTIKTPINFPRLLKSACYI
jgi:hypothetical protein